MTNQEQKLINAINEFELNQENIPVELIRAYVLLRKKFNQIRSEPPPVFTENNIPINMDNWKTWQFTGLHNWEFIDTNFYKEDLNAK
jgi:hypothetical protein